jgi:hemerythrin-like domain-containing protein
MSESVARGGEHPCQSSELSAGAETGTDGTLACDNLREDHRRIESYLDRLLTALQHLSVERIPEVQSIVGCIHQLSAVHFEKEEKILYPRLRLIQPQLLAQMDRQHEVVREVEAHVAEMLADPPQPPEARWLNELRCFGTELHDHIQHHIVDEEDQLFQVADNHLAIEEQARLANAMVAVQQRMAQNGNR